MADENNNSHNDFVRVTDSFRNRNNTGSGMPFRSEPDKSQDAPSSYGVDWLENFSQNNEPIPDPVIIDQDIYRVKPVRPASNYQNPAPRQPQQSKSRKNVNRSADRPAVNTNEKRRENNGPKKQSRVKKTNQSFSDRPFDTSRKPEQVQNRNVKKKKKKENSRKAENRNPSFTTGQKVSDVSGNNRAFFGDDTQKNKKKEKKKGPSFKERQNEKKNISRDKKISKENSYIREKNSGQSPDSRKGDIQKKRRTSSKVFGVVVLILVIIAILGSAGAWLARDTFVINSLDVVIPEKSTYTKEEIETASNIIKGGSMMTVKCKKSADIISKTLPYAGVVTVKRQWPDKVEITIEETKDRFAIMIGKKYLWLDENGKVLSETKKKIGKKQIKVLGFNENQEYEVGTKFEPSELNAEHYEILKSISESSRISGLNISEVEFFEKNLIIMKYNSYISLVAKKETNFAGKFAGVKDQLKNKNIKSDYYFDLRGNQQIRSNYGKFEPLKIED